MSTTSTAASAASSSTRTLRGLQARTLWTLHNVGDKGYISAEVQLDLFETASIGLETPPRSNQKGARPFPFVFMKVRKRIGTDFSHLYGQFLLIRNYAKNVDGLFTRIIGKISAFTVLQYINKINNKPIGQVKHALF